MYQVVDIHFLRTVRRLGHCSAVAVLVVPISAGAICLVPGTMYQVPGTGTCTWKIIAVLPVTCTTGTSTGYLQRRYAAISVELGLVAMLGTNTCTWYLGTKLH